MSGKVTIPIALSVFELIKDLIAVEDAINQCNECFLGSWCIEHANKHSDIMRELRKAVSPEPKCIGCNRLVHWYSEDMQLLHKGTFQVKKFIAEFISATAWIFVPLIFAISLAGCGKTKDDKTIIHEQITKKSNEDFKKYTHFFSKSKISIKQIDQHKHIMINERGQEMLLPGQVDSNYLERDKLYTFEVHSYLDNDDCKKLYFDVKEVK